MKKAEFWAAYPALADAGMSRREIAQFLGITPVAVSRHIWRKQGPRLMSQTDFIERYISIVRRCPEMPNREIAQGMGFTHGALIRRLSRARAAGKLSVYRVGVGHRPEIAPTGVTSGYMPPILPRRRRSKDLDRAA